jgi:hypothetical protein
MFRVNRVYIAQAVTRRLLVAEIRPCGICGRQSETGPGFLLASHHSTNALQPLLVAWTVSPFEAIVPRSLFIFQ